MAAVWQQMSAEVRQYFEENPIEGDIKRLYEPMNYILSLGGKRVRPVLCLLANQLFDGDKEEAMHAAIGIEMFHNFTLVHDDIMDEAPLRRGNPTVHKKWNRDVAILSGDALLVKVYQRLSNINHDNLPTVLDVFNRTAIEVCEGQQLDMDFELIPADELSLSDYIEMIRLKTAVLLAASLKIGAITANANAKDADLIYQFGLNLGIAFQIQDDFLDAFANIDQFGKQLGGDIIANKKTFLLLKAYEKANTNQKLKLDNCLIMTDEEQKIHQVLSFYNELNIQQETADLIDSYHDKAMLALNEINVDKQQKKHLEELSEFLMNRLN